MFPRTRDLRELLRRKSNGLFWDSLYTAYLNVNKHQTNLDLIVYNTDLFRFLLCRNKWFFFTYLTSVTCRAFWLSAFSKGLEHMMTLGLRSSNIFWLLMVSFKIVRICKVKMSRFQNRFHYWDSPLLMSKYSSQLWFDRKETVSMGSLA